MPTTLRHLYLVAERQAGYFTTAQAKEQGVSRQLLQRHLQSGSIRRETHGIYRLTDFPTSAHEDVAVATLLAGPDSVASHETALSVYDVGGAMPTAVHITTPHRFRSRRAGLIAHTDIVLDIERTRRENIPITTIERTLVDVANHSDPSLVRDALRDALATDLTTPRRINKQLGRRNSPLLASLIEQST